MKKILCVVLVGIFAAMSTFAATVTVTFTSGNILEGKMISYDDTTLVMEPYNTVAAKELIIKPEKVNFFLVSGVGRFDVVDGKFVPNEKAQAKLAKHPVVVRVDESGMSRSNAANPNEIIGRAFKSTGTIAMGVGFTSLVVGAILVGVGNTTPDSNGDAAEDASKIKTRANCATAGYVLLPMGASLTLIGVPLYIHGKRIADMQVKYNGTGAGIAFNF